jgi:hypothetical protein
MKKFIADWEETDTRTKQAFTELWDHLNSLTDISLEFNARPGVSYSLRPRHANQTDKSLFAMVDVIDDDPKERWLSVCFYGEMITDPEEAGDLIPEGLMGEDGYCFDLYEYDAQEILYLKERLTQAHENASK